MLVNRFTYTYDNAGNRTQAVEWNGRITTWTYDNTYQLTREHRTGSANLDVTYTYDPAGNRTVQIDSGSRTTYVYDAANQLNTEESTSGTTTYTYDNCGHRTEKETPVVSTFYTWDETNRLEEAEPVSGSVTFTYNADGNRVKKQAPGGVVRKFIYDFEKVLQETDDNDSATREFTTTNEEFGDLISAFGDCGTLYHEYDALGSTDALLDDFGLATQQYTYRAFGLSTESGPGCGDAMMASPMPLELGSTPQANERTFVGQKGYSHDLETDLYFMSARYYDPATGKFVSEDPIGFQGGDVNLYRYVGNNPVNEVDPSGKAAVICAGTRRPGGRSPAGDVLTFLFDGIAGRGENQILADQKTVKIGSKRTGVEGERQGGGNVFLGHNFHPLNIYEGLVPETWDKIAEIKAKGTSNEGAKFWISQTDLALTNEAVLKWFPNGKGSGRLSYFFEKPKPTGWLCCRAVS